MHFPQFHPLCHFWHLTVDHILCYEALSCLWEVTFGHSFSFPGSTSFPVGSSQIFNLGLQLFRFTLSLWDLTQTSTASQSPNLWPSLTMLLPPLSPLVLWAYIVSNNLLNSSIWMSYFITVTLNILWNWIHHFSHNTDSFFWLSSSHPWEMCWATELPLIFHSLSQLFIQPAIKGHTFFFFNTSHVYLLFSFHCYHFGQAWAITYRVEVRVQALELGYLHLDSSSTLYYVTLNNSHHLPVSLLPHRSEGDNNGIHLTDLLEN